MILGETFYWRENQVVAKTCAAVAEKPKKRKNKKQPVDMDMAQLPVHILPKKK